MKVHIGPYSSDLIPVRRWEISYTTLRHKTLYREEEDYDRLDKVVYWLLDKIEDLVRPINRWSNNRKRKVKIKIDNYDVWSADHTLAMIIHPVLVKLGEVKHGSPNVDDKDVPKHLKSTSAPPKENEWDVDDNHHKRWEWVLAEMIWAFEQMLHDDCNTWQFHHNSDQLEMITKPLEDNPKLYSIDFNHQKDPNKPAYWVDNKGKEAHMKRVNNGLRLFAKYYHSLWD